MTFIDTIWEHKMANTTATGLMSSPLWIQYLEGVSEVAAVSLPILGCLWFLIQIYFYIKNKGSK